MKQKEDECLEYLVERFIYNIKISKLYDLEYDTLKALNCHFKRFMNCERTYQGEKKSMEDTLKIHLWKE